MLALGWSGGLLLVCTSCTSSIGIIGNDNVMDNGTGISYMSVDTFFFFSGFLAFYSMLTSVVAFPSKAKAYEPRSLLQSACVSAKYTYAVVLHRYMRLTPMYFFILMVYMYVWPAFGDGTSKTRSGTLLLLLMRARRRYA